MLFFSAMFAINGLMIIKLRRFKFILPVILKIRLSWDRRNVFPSTAITSPFVSWLMACTHCIKQVLNSLGSIQAKTRSNVSVDGIPYGSSKNLLNQIANDRTYCNCDDIDELVAAVISPGISKPGKMFLDRWTLLLIHVPFRRIINNFNR